MSDPVVSNQSRVLSQEALTAIMQFATRFGLDAALIMLKNISKPTVTVDDAIAALRGAAEKSLEQIIAETPTPGT